MASIQLRKAKNGKLVYQAKIRRKGAAPQIATFHRLTDAKRWIQVTEATVVEGRHLKVAEAKRHTLGETIDRYLRDVLPHKSQSSIYMQTLQLK